MSSVNKAILVGRLGKDPDVRYMTSGEAVANISLATSENWKDKDGNKQEKTEWHNLVFFRRLAEIAGQYLKKGSHIYVEGKIQTRKWQDKDGKDRYTTEILVSEMQMLNIKQSQGVDSVPPVPEAKPEAGGGPANGGLAEMPDDIPF